MRPTLIPLLRWGVAGIALLALAASTVQLIVLIASWTGTPPDVPTIPVELVPTRFLTHLAWGFGFALLSMAIVVKAGQRGEALVAGLFLAVYALWAGVGRNPFLTATAFIVPLGFSIDALAHSIGIRFTQLFPKPLEPRAVAGLGRGPLGAPVTRGLAALTRPAVFWPFALVLEVLGRVGPQPGAYFLHVLLWLSLGTAYVYAGYRQGTVEERQRLFWIMEGVVAFLVLELAWVGLWAMNGLGVFSLNLGFWGRWLTVAEAWITLFCFAMAIFYSGAFDSGLILRRTTVLSAAGMLAVIVFIALETTLGEVAVDMLGVNTRMADIGIGVIAALAFRPISERIDRVVKRWTAKPHGESGVVAPP